MVIVPVCLVEMLNLRLPIHHRLRRLYGERLVGRNDMPSRWALLRIAAGGRCSLTLITPVGVLRFASSLSFVSSAGDQGSRDRRL
ncbi:hypothetical protein JQ633_01425 [Bradyrhizobium tropiciagri]|uniref:hypothetical protein n=1 Tax=Bradyrhizobium tropiciagri TaxID=312253 RepID=UPI001BA8EC7F|nr:hypothetical protein [Bradyrhizobium tropiciagri]MBR0869002.1 hypothetical protein [Bradyrhizobium tropiciagri]